MISQRIDRIALTCLDERGDGRPVLCPGIVLGEKTILPLQGYRKNGSHDGIIVNLDAAIGQEDAEPAPVFGHVGERLAERRLTKDTGAMMAEPKSHVSDQRR